jgi:hypothetical protein
MAVAPFSGDQLDGSQFEGVSLVEAERDLDGIEARAR